MWAVICRTLARNEYCHHNLVFVHGHHVYVYMYSKTQRFSTVYVHKELSLVQLDTFLVQGAYCLQYKHLAKALSMVVMLHSYISM